MALISLLLGELRILLTAITSYMIVSLSEEEFKETVVMCEMQASWNCNQIETPFQNKLNPGVFDLGFMRLLKSSFIYAHHFPHAVMQC